MIKQWIKDWLEIRTSDVKLTLLFEGGSDVTQEDKNAHFNKVRDMTARSFDALKDLLGIENDFDECGDTRGYRFIKKAKGKKRKTK